MRAVWYDADMKRPLRAGSPSDHRPSWLPQGIGASCAGMSLIEILIATFILVMAALPMLGVIGSGAADTDVLRASLFAQTSAAGILDAALDALPFEALVRADGMVPDLDGKNPEPGVGKVITIADPNRLAQGKAFLNLIGGQPEDGLTRGTLTDERGLSYRVKLFVFPVPAVVSASDSDGAALRFGFLPRPLYEQANDATGKSAWYSQDQFVRPGVARPYDLPVEPVIRRASELGVPVGTEPRFPHCCLKKLLLRIQWDPRKGGERSLELMTLKAALE